MKRVFTIAYSVEEANEIGHFIRSKGYDGVQNDSYRYCKEMIEYKFNRNKIHNREYIFIGVDKGKMIVCHSKKPLIRRNIPYIKKKRIFFDKLEKI